MRASRGGAAHGWRDAITYSQNAYLDVLLCNSLRIKHGTEAFTLDGSIVIRNEDSVNKMRSVAERNYLASYK